MSLNEGKCSSKYRKALWVPWAPNFINSALILKTVRVQVRRREKQQRRYWLNLEERQSIHKMRKQYEHPSLVHATHKLPNYVLGICAPLWRPGSVWYHASSGAEWDCRRHPVNKTATTVRSGNNKHKAETRFDLEFLEHLNVFDVKTHEVSMSILPRDVFLRDRFASNLRENEPHLRQLRCWWVRDIYTIEERSIRSWKALKATSSCSGGAFSSSNISARSSIA